jgi:hypothetical protein
MWISNEDSKLAQAAVLLNCFRGSKEGAISNPGQNTDYTDSGVSWFS